MATKGDRNMQEVYSVYNVIYLYYIFMCFCWFYSHNETSVRDHEILKKKKEYC